VRAEECRPLALVVVLGVGAGEREALGEADASARSLLEVDKTSRHVAHTGRPVIVDGTGHVGRHSLVIDLQSQTSRQWNSEHTPSVMQTHIIAHVILVRCADTDHQWQILAIVNGN